jgi:hypothetical protein
MDRLLQQFDGAMTGMYPRVKLEASCTAAIFLQMILDRGALSTFRFLINSGKASGG